MDASLIKEFEAFYGCQPQSVVSLPLAGSDRRYYRFSHPNGQSIIGTFSEQTTENKRFIELAQFFGHQGLPVPQVYHVSEDFKSYFQSDLGNLSLLEALKQNGLTPSLLASYQSSLKHLARLQTLTIKAIAPLPHFDKAAILRDFNYFIYNFVKPNKIDYDANLLDVELSELAQSFGNSPEEQGIMYRDFQARNIYLDDNNQPYFIDFQGSLMGPSAYDAVSLLYQAKAQLPESVRQSMLAYYADCYAQHRPINKQTFLENAQRLTLLRLLQVLGSYGFRGLFERRPHFLSSIPEGLKNLADWLKTHPQSLSNFPELAKLLAQTSHPDMVAKYTIKQATPEHKLQIYVCSFSYKKGYPANHTGHGGGYVFDCRGIYNPGRFPEYVELTGKDKSVADFLATKTEMPNFLKNIFSILDISVTDYIARDFDHLSINFGCTGGRHRSVYAAEQTAAYLKQTYNVQVKLIHENQPQLN